MNTIIDAVRSLPPLPMYAIVFGAAFGSTAFALDLILPGETVVLLGGWVAAQGEPRLLGVFGAAALGAWLGDTFSYWVGRKGGRPIVERWQPVAERLGPEIERAEGFYERHGGVAVFLGRWVGALRSVMAFVAGVAGMGFLGFLAWNLLASLSWSAAITLIGYYFGGVVVSAFREATLPITIGVLTLVALWFGVRWVKQHPDRAPDPLAERLPSPRATVGLGLVVLVGVVTLMVRS